MGGGDSTVVHGGGGLWWVHPHTTATYHFCNKKIFECVRNTQLTESVSVHRQSRTVLGLRVWKWREEIPPFLVCDPTYIETYPPPSTTHYFSSDYEVQSISTTTYAPPSLSSNMSPAVRYEYEASNTASSCCTHSPPQSILVLILCFYSWFSSSVQHIIYRRSNTGTKFLPLTYSLLVQYHSCDFGIRRRSNTTMSSKLVKKLLQQTTLPTTNNNLGNDINPIPKRKNKSAKLQPIPKSKEEIVHEQAQSLLRLDSAVKKHSSNTAQRSFQRHTSNLNHQQNARRVLKRNVGGISNSRSSSSSFASKLHERSFDKERHKREEEEGYFEDLARALKKAKKGKK